MFIIRVVIILRRSRKGAWIEILLSWLSRKQVEVAPVRERGLKCKLRPPKYYDKFSLP